MFAFFISSLNVSQCFKINDLISLGSCKSLLSARLRIAVRNLRLDSINKSVFTSVS